MSLHGSEKQRISIIRVVTAVWAINIIAGAIPPLHYEPKESINGIFMAVVGSLFIAGNRSRENDPDKKEDQESS